MYTLHTATITLYKDCIHATITLYKDCIHTTITLYKDCIHTTITLLFPLVQFCGEVIAGLSLLSPSVMQLQHEEDSERCIWALLPRLSLYIMR